ncbi:sensor histidine kinase [Raoultibacter phocaeensis]|uniref:sensor histidine kinase n=1 Tax=Raoultibacter phocaeensis TaxID=2479841 RepID=UPI001119361A|nr:HAMP domain-containing sensor histidine kinase [Raoultibacter phocaeensis]
MADVPMIVALVLALAVGGYFCLRYFLLKRSIRRADRELREIVEDLGENRIVKLAAPDGDLERLLGTVNRALGSIRREAVLYARHEAELKSQVERISHDLRTPLTSMLGYLALIDESGLDEGARESLAIVKRKSEMLMRLIGQFYDLSTVRSADFVLELTEVELGRLVRESVAAQYRLLDEAGLDVRLSLPEHAVVVLADRDSAERVIANLLHNAGKYAKGCLEVGLSEDTEERCVRMTFANDTQALDESEVARLFEPFYTVDGSRSQEQSGLGLAISRYLVEHMGGTIEAHVEQRDGRPWLRFEVVLCQAARPSR